jgi:hypothetical protein
MSVLINFAPIVLEVASCNGNAVEPNIRIRGLKECFFFEYIGKYYGPFVSVEEAQLSVEKVISASAPKT